METKANYVVVGIFTLLAILGAFAFVYWTAAVGDRGETATLRFRIPGSASGLGRGSTVLFNGVKVGDVQRVFIDVTNPTVAIADAVVDRLTPITKSTQADIGLAGLTGQANIELKGADPKEENLLDVAEREGRIAEIVAKPSAVTNLLQTAQDIFGRANTVLTQLEGFSKDVRQPLTDTVQNAAKFSAALGENADGINKFLQNVTELSNELAGVSGKLDGMINAAEGLLKAVSPEKVQSVVDNVDQFTANLKQTSGQFDQVIKDVDATVASINELAKNSQGTIGKVDKVLDGVDPDTIRSALSNIERASANADKAAADINKVTSKFGARADDIDRIISDAKDLSQRLNEASVRVNGVLVKVDDLLGSGQAEGVVTDASATLKSIKQVADTVNTKLGPIADGLTRFTDQGLTDATATLKSIKQVADTLNTKIGPIADGVNRFTSQGLSDVRGLISDSRRSISRIEEAVTDLSRNPQRIITGGDGAVRQFDGRSRR